MPIVTNYTSGSSVVEKKEGIINFLKKITTKATPVPPVIAPESRKSKGPKFGRSTPKGAEFPIGQCVISRSNHYADPPEIGFVVGYWDQDSDWSAPIPLVVYDINSKDPKLCMGILVPYSDMMMKHLSTMNYKEQYDFLAGWMRGDAFPEEEWKETPIKG